MKQVIGLPDGSRIELDGSDVKHISKDDNVWYDSTRRIAYGQEQIDAVRKHWRRDLPESVNLPEAVKIELEKVRPLLEEDIEA